MICTQCKMDLPETSFSFRNKSKQQLHTKCKQCHAMLSRTHYTKNKQKYLTKAKKHRVKANENYDSLIKKLKTKCYHCGESDPCCLDFHHLDPTQKQYDVPAMRGLSIAAILNEIQKCIVVCSNCHRKIHAGKLVAPVGLEPTHSTF